MRTGKGWGVAGAANVGGRRKYLEGCLPALCNTGRCHQSRGPNIVYPLSPTYFLSPLPPSLLPAFGVWGKGPKSFLTLISAGQKFKSQSLCLGPFPILVPNSLGATSLAAPFPATRAQPAHLWLPGQRVGQVEG